ncbi:transcriptional regulator [Massilia sp. WF1]|uniref:GGDEF domain-containing protein n=1 Tax=unclassified Massilia TaxID=2609279 RepID=UPI00064A8765|nr:MULTISPECIES: GGDEF domain-containing protein [unclassified Massilia]ALK96899.1 transcriptional regulator [Massilia sp. WG5]KLU37966.1 transcriptional regulator [Massilia sp. WF1]
MSQQGMYVSPMAQRRAGFDQACGPLFARLDLADSADAAAALMAGSAPDLLVIDLERFEPGIDLQALGGLLARRAGAPVLLLCPFANARWLPLLHAFGPAAYAITPIEPARLQDAVRRCLASPSGCAPAADADALRALLALRTRVQAALDDTDEEQGLAERLSQAFLAWPGVLHAAVFRLAGDADLQLDAEQGRGPAVGLRLGTLLQRSERLLQAPLRHAFPGLLAAATGELAILDTLEQAGEPALAEGLRAHGVAQALGIPLPADGPGAPRGALSLLLDSAAPLAPEAFDTLRDCAAMAVLGLRMSDMNLESEQLLARLTYVSTMDALTGVANRRHGEELLEREVRRARRYRTPLALLSFDIDRFKAINDGYGHPVGDVALRTVADCVRAVMRSSDVLVRSGGEEFHVIAPHTSAIEGLKMAEKIRHAVEQTAVPGCDHVTVSLGVAQLGEQESADSLVQRVDAAMARAKRAGRNCVELAMQ